MSVANLRSQLSQVAHRWEARGGRLVWRLAHALLASNARTTAGKLQPGPRGLDPEFAESLLRLHLALLALPNIGKE